MKPRLCAATVVGLAVALLGGSGASVSAQPVATITLPDPGGVEQLYAGCNNISLTFPDDTPSQTVVQAVTPAGTVETLWRFNGPLNKFEGFSPAYPQASDLMTVNFLDAVWLCGAAAPSNTALVAAPIDDLELLIRESFPPQYALRVVSGLPNGCHQFSGHELARDGTRITITVWNRVPTDPGTACTQVYGHHEEVIELGTDFEPGTEYTVKINDKTLTFTAR